MEFGSSLAFTVKPTEKLHLLLGQESPTVTLTADVSCHYSLTTTGP